VVAASGKPLNLVDQGCSFGRDLWWLLGTAGQAVAGVGDPSLGSANAAKMRACRWLWEKATLVAGVPSAGPYGVGFPIPSLVGQLTRSLLRFVWRRFRSASDG